MNQYPPNGPQQPPMYPQGQTPPPGYPQYPPMQGYPPQQQQPPMPPQQPAKKKLGIMKIGCISLVVIVAFAVIIGIANGGKSSSTASPSSSSGSTPAATQAPQTWTTTHTYSGNGAKKTETIAVGDNWKIQWSCTPSSFMGNSYNVIISVYNSDGTPADYGAVNTMCKDGNTSGESSEHSAGNVYLSVDSEGDWSITISELK